MSLIMQSLLCFIIIWVFVIRHLLVVDSFSHELSGQMNGKYYSHVHLHV